MISRRGFLKLGIIFGGAALLDGFVIEPKHLVVEAMEIPVEGLPRAFDGFSICQVSDVHHSPFVGLGYIERVVEKANSLAPDLVALTGDYIETDKEYMAPAIKALGNLRARHGTVAVLGNHDYFIGRDFTRDVITSNGITLLENSQRIIEMGGGALCIAGTEDLLEGAPDAGTSLEGVPQEVPRVLLTHHPDYCEELPEDLRVDVVLAGHTHGGQVRIPFSIAPIVPSRYGQKYSGGLVTLGKGKNPARVYVSRGVGVVTVPVRFNCPPEITLIRLKCAADR